MRSRMGNIKGQSRLVEFAAFDRNSRRFTAERMALDYVALYERLLLSGTCRIGGLEADMGRQSAEAAD